MASDLSPDTVFGKMRISESFYSTQKLSSLASNFATRIFETEDDGSMKLSTLLEPTYVQPEERISSQTFTSDTIKVIASSNLDAIGARVKQVASPLESTDLASKQYCDSSFYSTDIASTTYYASQHASDQVNFLKWGTFCLSDQVHIDDGSDALGVESIILVSHKTEYFNGIVDAWLGIYEYVDDFTEPDESYLIARSTNSFDVEKFDETLYSNYRYDFGSPVYLDVGKKYVFKFSGEAGGSMLLSSDPHGSFQNFTSSGHVQHFGRLFGGIWYPEWPDSSTLQHYQLYMKAIIAKPAVQRGKPLFQEMLEIVDSSTGKVVDVLVEDSQLTAISR